MKLIEGWKSAYRFISVQAMVLAGAIQGAWLYVPDDLRSTVPQSWLQGITLALMVMGVAGRLVKQKEVP